MFKAFSFALGNNIREVQNVVLPFWDAWTRRCLCLEGGGGGGV
jgi:hypothetical protein